ncbi:hypothetical protein G6F59_017239 [Rhizopus arrhizus]|nr:hypothetical protein G6F59_017239 [Rhizopus arrhizus]
MIPRCTVYPMPGAPLKMHPRRGCTRTCIESNHDQLPYPPPGGCRAGPGQFPRAGAGAGRNACAAQRAQHRHHRAGGAVRGRHAHQRGGVRDREDLCQLPALGR